MPFGGFVLLFIKHWIISQSKHTAPLLEVIIERVHATAPQVIGTVEKEPVLRSRGDLIYFLVFEVFNLDLAPSGDNRGALVFLMNETSGRITRDE